MTLYFYLFVHLNFALVETLLSSVKAGIMWFLISFFVNFWQSKTEAGSKKIWLPLHVQRLILQCHLNKQIQYAPGSFQWLHKPKKTNVFMGRTTRSFLWSCHRGNSLWWILLFYLDHKKRKICRLFNFFGIQSLFFLLCFMFVSTRILWVEY